MAHAKKLTKTIKGNVTKAKQKITAETHLLFHCFVCNMDISVYRKDENGVFVPQTICPHMAYKGVV